MLDCWNEEYLERPKFSGLVQQLTQFIQTPHRLVPLAKQRFIFINHPDQPNIVQVTSVMEWLHSLELDLFTSLFVNAGYHNLSQLCHFTRADLMDITEGHMAPDEQTRVLESLKRMRSQLVLISSKSLLTDEGYLV